MIMPQDLLPGSSPARAVAEPSKQHRVTMPTLWGLEPRMLHEAYWRSRGVHVIESGRGAVPDRDAELYMLIEPDHLIEFDLSAVTESMTWNGAAVMRLRLIAPGDDHYDERIVVSAERGDDVRGTTPGPGPCDTSPPIRGVRIERIQRLYRTSRSASHRLIITRSREHAELWSRMASRRQAWMRIRRSLPYYRVVHWRFPGARFHVQNHADAARYLHRLAQIWPDPHASIEGIWEPIPQVWIQQGASLRDDDLVIGPALIGVRDDNDDPLLVIGPDVVVDSELNASGQERQPTAVRVRGIGEIEPSDRRRAGDDDPTPAVQQGPAGQRDNRGESISSTYLFVKRAADIVFSASVLLILSPLLLVLALAVMLDDGRPIFFGHLRQSRGGRLFRCWKFRTMRRDADRMTRELQALNQCDGPQFYIANDPRVTRVGRVMRRFHLDELPQFWNVLVGDMSIVGPRPSPDDENQFCPAWREARLSVRPGITGLWQVERTRAPGMDFQEWIRFDIEYVRRAGLVLDVQILAKTVLRLLRRR